MNTTTITVDGEKQELVLEARYRVRYGPDLILHDSKLLERARNGDLIFTTESTTGPTAVRIRPRSIKGIWRHVEPRTYDITPEGGLEPTGFDALPDEFPAEDLPDADTGTDAVPGRQDGETAINYITRLEAALGAHYVPWIESDAGQALLREAEAETKEARRIARQAERLAAREEAARVRALADAKRKPGKVEIVAPPTNGKPTRAARKALGMDEEPQRAPTRRSGRPAAPPKPITNAPVRLGEEPIEVNGVTVLPVLNRDGSRAEHQLHNIIWRCPSCGKRVRAATCKNGHRATKAPDGYRVEDRKVTA